MRLQQRHALIHTREMSQALTVLQMPVMELTAFVEKEMEENPLLEYSEEEEKIERLEILRELISSSRFKKGGGEFENGLPHIDSLFEVLMRQAREVFSAEELEIAERIIGNLNEDGFLENTEFENDEKFERVLQEIQKFEPIGVGARSLQESLLIQLRAFGKEGSLIFILIQDHFEDLLKNRLPMIAKKINRSVSEIKKCLDEERVHLDMTPGKKCARGHYEEIVQSVRPDILISSDCRVVVNQEDLPPLKINPHYLSLLNSGEIAKETKEYLKIKLASGKWLVRGLCERHNTLHRIAEELVFLQREFFEKEKGALKPLTMKEVATKLELHESTIARAVANKYISCERGILPLRSFFTLNASVKEEVERIIGNENKKRPLSDEAISKELQRRGILCARRTVTKYREELKIPSTSKRRGY